MSTREAYENPENMAEYAKQATGYWDFFPKEFIHHFINLIRRGGSDNRVLNIGSGLGHESVLLQNAGLEVVNMDISSYMTNRTKARFTTVQGDMMHLPFAENSFSAVWTHKTYVHASEGEFPEGLKEIRRVVKPSGILSIGMIEGWETATKTSGTYDEERVMTFFKINQLASTLRKAGFRPVSSGSGNFRVRRIRAEQTSYLIANCIEQG